MQNKIKYLCVCMCYLASFFSFIDNTTQPVDCKTGNIRLVGGKEDFEGRLEVCINQVWGTACSVSWDSFEIKVACRQLGYQETGI